MSAILPTTQPFPRALNFICGNPLFCKCKIKRMSKKKSICRLKKVENPSSLFQSCQKLFYRKELRKKFKKKSKETRSSHKNS